MYVFQFISLLQAEEQVIPSHLGKMLSVITYREVWTDIAELLIRQVCGTCIDTLPIFE